MIALLLITVLLWITDSWHGIAPAWVGLAAACVLPVAAYWFPDGGAVCSRCQHPHLSLCGGDPWVDGFGEPLRVGDWLGSALLNVIPQTQDRPFTAFGLLIGITTLLNFVVTANGVPALFTPLAQVLSEGSGLPLTTVLMTQVIGYATPLLPYQASPIVVAMGDGGKFRRVKD
ncbi:Uncharacterised protein [Serratia fonticola]|uniref:Transporter, divalent anion:Na+ symporter (DASS) family n=1 Tax=Serratia fonticola TaxID=47917 RepID=A0A4U9TTM8_SERFO|nr:Uncharacterised protein [Serratia fonticola]